MTYLFCFPLVPRSVAIAVMLQYMARAEVAAQERPGGPVLDFSISEVADLPPKIRAVVEDNRVGTAVRH